MNWIIALSAALIGYLLGGISFARIVGRFLAPGEDLDHTEMEIAGSDRKFTFSGVSATSIVMRKGAPAGCLTSLLDMLKAAVPTLAFRLAFPDQPYFLIAAAAAVAGHNYPIYYRFRGGRGISPLWGSLLVIDWLSVPATTLLGMLLGMGLVGDMFVAYTAGTLLLIPWFWFRFDGDAAYLLYAVAVNIFFWLAVLPDMRTYLEFKRAGHFRREELMQQMQSSHLGKLMELAEKRGMIRPVAIDSGTIREEGQAD